MRVNGIEIIAHRGASAHEAEHTFAAYDLALAQGADRLELDIRASADGELLVVHDRTLLRTARDPRAVAQLRRGDVDRLLPSIRPLRLDEVLARYGRSTDYLVDLKDPHPEWEGDVAATLERHGVGDRCLVQSFDVQAMRRLRATAPDLPVAALYRRRPLSMATLDAIAAFARSVVVCHRFLDAGFVAAARDRGLSVGTWTVNEPATVLRAAALGVDGVITDAPDVAVAALGREVVAPLAVAA